jgi:hypothetical protein
MIQHTYCRLTSAAVLRTAHVAQSKAGSYEVWVNPPKIGECIARVGTRPDGWGGEISDILNLDHQDGRIRMTMSRRSLEYMLDLQGRAESKQRSALRAEGVAI